MASRHALLTWLTALTATFASTGCLFLGNQQSSSSSSTQNTTDQDVAQYDALQAKLEANRTVFKDGGAGELAGIDTRLYWTTYPTDSPVLHSFDTQTNLEVDYKFTLNSLDDHNYRASEQIIAQAELSGDNVIYHAYSVTDPLKEFGNFVLPAPSDGTKWNAYAPDGMSIYYVTTDSGTTLWKWDIGQPQGTMLFNLEDAGATVQEFEDFGVDGNTMIFIEGGRIWSLDIAAKKATWLGNKTEASAAWPDQDGVLFSTADGPFFYSYASHSLRDIKADIMSSSFELNQTFASAHLYDHDLTRNRNLVGYLSTSGVFTFDMGSGEVKPVLLDARDNSTVYANPVILSDNTLFVVGLQSNDGAIGFDGPLYRVQLQ